MGKKMFVKFSNAILRSIPALYGGKGVPSPPKAKYFFFVSVHFSFLFYILGCANADFLFIHLHGLFIQNVQIGW